MPRPLVLLLLSALFGGFALLIHEPDDLQALQREAASLQSKLDQVASELEQSNAEWLQRLATLGPQDWMREYMDQLEQERARTGIVFLGYRSDTLICWSGSPPLKASLLGTGNSGVLIRDEAVYLHATASVGVLQMHAIRPVWLAPPLENRYLQGGFHPSLGVAKGAAVAEGGQLGPEVTDALGALMFRLAWRDGTLETGDWIWLRLLLFSLTAILLIAALWLICDQLVQRGMRWGGILLFTSTIVALRWWSLSMQPVAPFDRLPLFDPAIYATSFAFPSLGDLLINTILLILIGFFVRRSIGPAQRARGIPAMVAGWVLIVVLSKWITDLVIGLVEDSSVDLDLYHVQGLSQASLVALISMALLFGTWLLLSTALIGPMNVGGRIERVILVGAAVLFAGGLFLFLERGGDILPWTWPVPVLWLLVIGKGERPRFAHLVVGLVVISVFSALILTRYTGHREQRERQVLAERLAAREDPVVELLFLEMAPRLRTDPGVYEMLNTGRACSTSDLDALVRQRFFGGYWERYDVRLFAFGTKGNVLCATDPEPPRSFRGEQSVFTDPRAAADMPDLLMEELPGQGTFYHARVSVMPVDTLPPAQLIVELYPRALSQGLGFPELLLAGDDPLSRRAIRYTYARFERGQLAEQTGPYAYPLQWKIPLGAEGQSWYVEGGFEHFVTSTPQGTLLVLGLPEPTLLDKATTFSYLFTFFSLLLALAIGIRSVILARGVQTIGIGIKVRIVLVLFAATSLIFFGVGTRRLLDAQYVQRAESSILEKARSVHTELQHRLDGEPVLTPTNAPYLDHLLGRASNVFFTDITMYQADGRMLATSRPQMFTSGLLGRRMDPMAYTEVVLNGKSAFVHEESIGTAVFRSAYMPLRDRNGKVLAYLSLPAFADQRLQEEERSSVLIAVVNLFVLLFALSVLVAVFISNWTLRPLDLLKRALSGVDLRGANKPIRYRGDDEVGQLVQVYNQKVQELHESAELLAISERETAWREMARQVAHEIKNPLTPMKLGIQQFQRSWDPTAPNARERLERFSNAMVEQIDALNGVATAFSQFAQMPVAQPQQLDLNDVARAAVDVFQATPNIRITLNEHPGLLVHADREHLLRVFNNLLKNAVQSIPDDQEGEVTVSLRGQNGQSVVEISDNGCGIPESSRDRIFTPSFTTKSSGMGLGLAMVKRIVEGAGGKVWFTSSSADESMNGEEGTTFHVALPTLK